MSDILARYRAQKRVEFMCVLYSLPIRMKYSASFIATLQKAFHFFLQRQFRTYARAKPVKLQCNFFAVLLRNCLYAVTSLIFLAFSVSLPAITTSSRSSQEVLDGFALGMYIGGLRGAGGIYPAEPQSPVGVPKLGLAGVSIKYRKGFIMARAAAEGGLPLMGGSGTDSTGTVSTTYKLTQIHAPVSMGFSFPLIEKNSFYILAGYSFLAGTLDVGDSVSSNTYTFKASGIHFITGIEINITESSVISLEWMHTAGITGSLDNSNAREREISFSNNLILLGYSYYFKF